MSVKIMTYVWDNSRQTGTALLMLLALADHANDAGQCWPMIDRLADKCRVNRRQAQSLLKALEDAGDIVIERGQGRGHPSVYTVKGAVENTFSLKGAVENTFSLKGAVENTFSPEKVQPRTPFHSPSPLTGIQSEQDPAERSVPDPQGSLDPSSSQIPKTLPKESLVITRDEKGTPSVYSERFEAWWRTYPSHRRVDKKACYKKWVIKKLESRTDEIIANTNAMKLTKQWQEPTMIPNSTTYLNQDRYDTPPEGARSQGMSDELMAKLREIERQAIEKDAAHVESRRV